MNLNFKKLKFLKNIYFYILDSIVIFLKLNKKNNTINKKHFVIWLAETGSRDFIPRLAQATALWKNYSIPSIVIHKHFLKKIDKKLLKDSVLIDKSATVNCIRRLRYSKLNGCFNIVIPEELLICNKLISQIQGSLHPRTINYIDLIACKSSEIKNYLDKQNSHTKVLDILNPRLCKDVIQQNCEKYFDHNTIYSEIVDDNFILINDK